MTSFSKNHIFTGKGDLDHVLIGIYSLKHANSTADIREELDRLRISAPASNNLATCVRAWQETGYIKYEQDGKSLRYTNINIQRQYIPTLIIRQLDEILSDRPVQPSLESSLPPSPSLQLLREPIQLNTERNQSMDIADAILTRVAELLELEERIAVGEFNIDKVRALEDTILQLTNENTNLIDMVRKLKEELDNRPNVSVLERFAARQQ